jgi:hypothetical protein
MKARIAKTEQKLVEANKELQNAGKGGVQAKMNMTLCCFGHPLR